MSRSPLVSLPHPRSGMRVPWRVTRMARRHPRIENAGADAADHVRVFTGLNPQGDQRLGTLVPGDSAEICLCELDLDTAVVTIAWFSRRTDVEYIWRFVV